MLVFDTTVVSELLRPRPDRNVMAWAENRPAGEAALAATTVAELLAGVRIMPAGVRRGRLETEVEQLIGRFTILAFDRLAAVHYAELVAARRAAGRPIATFDAQIAATARAHGAAVATRDLRAFEGCGVGLVDPWAGPGD